MGNAGRAAWVVVEHQTGMLQEVTLEILGEARRIADLIGLTVWALVINGELTEDAVSQLGSHGADKVLLVESCETGNERYYPVEVQLGVLSDLCKWGNPWLLAMAATSLGNETAACLAAKLGVGLVTECTDLRPGDGRLEADRMAYDDQATITYALKKEPYLVTVRPGILGVGSPSGKKKPEVTRARIAVGADNLSDGQREELVIPGKGDFSCRIIVEGTLEADPETVDLAEAEVIVTAGRGVQGGEGMHIVQDFATTLGAPLGATRALLDLGAVGEEKLIGQSGKTVKPRIYIAAGVSGASQHMTAVKGAVKIVAINTDRTAPIFQQAELGVIGKLEEILPIVTAKIREQEIRQETNNGS